MYEDLVKKLRETPSRSKGELLDDAADTIEALDILLDTVRKQRNTAVAALKTHSSCKDCRHKGGGVNCDVADGCDACPLDCACKECVDGSRWQWNNGGKDKTL